MSVHQDLTNVRLFIGRLAAVRIIVMMTFSEGFIQKFMYFLGRLATLQGSAEQKYTEVHGVSDVAHMRELPRALAVEIEFNPPEAISNFFEGVELLRAVIGSIVLGASADSSSPTSSAGPLLSEKQAKRCKLNIISA
jgi:hypothetical protein